MFYVYSKCTISLAPCHYCSIESMLAIPPLWGKRCCVDNDAVVLNGITIKCQLCSCVCSDARFVSRSTCVLAGKQLTLSSPSPIIATLRASQPGPRLPRLIFIFIVSAYALCLFLRIYIRNRDATGILVLLKTSDTTTLVCEKRKPTRQSLSQYPHLNPSALDVSVQRECLLVRWRTNGAAASQNYTWS